MLKFTTESGAQYLYDMERSRIKRLNGPEIRDTRHPDGEWHNLRGITTVAVGYWVSMMFAENMRVRETTTIVSVETVDSEAEVE